MTIERDSSIDFHNEGTLIASTRWISTHDEGIAEWMENARRAYQVDRANVAYADRISVLLLKDYDTRGAARVGLLDVGAADRRNSYHFRRGFISPSITWSVRNFVARTSHSQVTQDNFKIKVKDDWVIVRDKSKPVRGALEEQYQDRSGIRTQESVTK